eukprot:3878494-Rhodomonas_salina.2
MPWQRPTSRHPPHGHGHAGKKAHSDTLFGYTATSDKKTQPEFDFGVYYTRASSDDDDAWSPDGSHGHRKHHDTMVGHGGSRTEPPSPRLAACTRHVTHQCPRDHSHVTA